MRNLEIVDDGDDTQDWEFQLNETVQISVTDQSGTVVGQATFTDRDDRFRVLMHGTGKKKWFTRTRLSATTKH